MNKHGFTLIEILIVLAIIAIITFLISANLSFFNRMIVRSEIQKLYGICRYLQQCAMVDNVQHILTFDQINNTYTFGNTTEKLPAHIKFGFIQGAKGPPSSPAHPIIHAITFPSQSIIFYPEGIIKSGTVYVTDATSSCMYALSSPVSQISFLRMYRFDGDSWQQL